MHPAMYWAYTSFGCEEMCCNCFFFLVYITVMYCVFILTSDATGLVRVCHLVCPSSGGIVDMCILEVVRFIHYKYIYVYSASCSFIRSP